MESDMAPHSWTGKDRAEFRRLEAALEESGGRGVELAEQIDRLRQKRDLGGTPTEVAQASFKAIDEMAYAARPDVEEVACLIDGTMYSPSTRACPYAEHVWQHGTDGEWEEFEEELDQLIDAYAHGGWHLFWEDGSLWIAGPLYEPED